MNSTPQYGEPEAVLFDDDGSIPNNPNLPLVVYRCRRADGSIDLAAWFEERFQSNNWSGCWRNGIYPYHHYHSLSHEALGVYSGEADVQLGGENGRRFTLKRGDVVVIPAGVGHKRIHASSDFGVVGAYPEGRDYDILRGDASDRPEALDHIQQVPLPATDPVFGEDGPLLKRWRDGSGG